MASMISAGTLFIPLMTSVAAVPDLKEKAQMYLDKAKELERLITPLGQVTTHEKLSKSRALEVARNGDIQP